MAKKITEKTMPEDKNTADLIKSLGGAQRIYKYLLSKNKNITVESIYKWKKNGVLLINKYGIPEPVETKEIIPSIVLLPLLAYDKNKNRIGYGKGFYDKFLNKFLKTRKKILTIGVAFSFQKHHKLPNNKKDFKLNYIINEKGIV